MLARKCRVGEILSEEKSRRDMSSRENFVTPYSTKIYFDVTVLMLCLKIISIKTFQNPMDTLALYYSFFIVSCDIISC